MDMGVTGITVVGEGIAMDNLTLRGNVKNEERTKDSALRNTSCYLMLHRLHIKLQRTHLSGSQQSTTIPLLSEKVKEG